MMTYGNTTTGGVPDSFYALLEYDSLPENFFDSLGTHWCDCYLNVGSGEIGSSDDSPIITLYPNPSGERIIIEFSRHSDAMDATLELISADGRVLKQLPINGMLNQIDISSLPRGIYVAKISHQGSVAAKKFIRE
jgi:hypothetical protein